MTKLQRGQRQDGDVTRSRILEVAGTLFAKTGFAETPSKTIAAQAEVDLASINYHFGSRNGLYQAVLVAAHRRLVDLAALQKLAESPLSAEEKLSAVIAYLVPELKAGQDDWHLKVLAREILSPSSHITVLFQTELMPKLAFVRAILSEVTGIPVENPALSRCLVCFAAPCMMLLIGPRSVPGPLHEVTRMPRQELINHLRTYALAGLGAIGAEFKSSVT